MIMDRENGKPPFAIINESRKKISSLYRIMTRTVSPEQCLLQSNVPIPAPSHYDAFLVFPLFSNLAAFLCPRASGASPYGGVYCGDPLFRALVARIGRLDVPHIRLEDVTPASYAHLREITHGILSLDVA